MIYFDARGLPRARKSTVRSGALIVQVWKMKTPEGPRRVLVSDVGFAVKVSPAEYSVLWSDGATCVYAYENPRMFVLEPAPA